MDITWPAKMEDDYNLPSAAPTDASVTAEEKSTPIPPNPDKLTSQNNALALSDARHRVGHTMTKQEDRR